MRILVLSPRIPAGLLTAAAWDALRSAPQVVAAVNDRHVAALRDAGVDVAIGERPSGQDAIWIPEPGDVSWAHALAEQMLEGSDDEYEVISGSFDPVGARPVTRTLRDLG